MPKQFIRYDIQTQSDLTSREVANHIIRSFSVGSQSIPHEEINKIRSFSGNDRITFCLTGTPGETVMIASSNNDITPFKNQNDNNLTFDQEGRCQITFYVSRDPPGFWKRYAINIKNSILGNSEPNGVRKYGCSTLVCCASALSLAAFITSACLWNHLKDVDTTTKETLRITTAISGIGAVTLSAILSFWNKMPQALQNATIFQCSCNNGYHAPE